MPHTIESRDQSQHTPIVIIITMLKTASSLCHFLIPPKEGPWNYNLSLLLTQETTIQMIKRRTFFQTKQMAVSAAMVALQKLLRPHLNRLVTCKKPMFKQSSYHYFQTAGSYQQKG
jgi:hypothetical protein